MTIKGCDAWLLLPVLLLCSIGLLALYSALGSLDLSQCQFIFKKQALWHVGGIISMLGATFIRHRKLRQFDYLIYFISVFLLILVLISGKSSGGAQRWLDLKFFSIQPSEIAKFAVVVIVAGFYEGKTKKEGLRTQDLLKPIFFTIIPFLLIMKQPDFGTAMLIAFIVISMTFFMKLNKKAALITIFCCVTLIPIFWFLLKNYQKERILVFLNPDMDPLGTGYHIIQSKIAIGSGMLFGKGFRKGTQNILSFLPEQHTDFIFSVIAEEWGFIGSFTVLLIFFVLILRGLIIAKYCRDSFGTILAVGIVSIISWHVFINVGMVMGIVPVVGVTLPFISYGGSSLITMMFCIGILLSISKSSCYV